MCVCVCVLTDAGQQVIKPLFGEKRVLQATEVKFENASHRVDVVIILLICQRIVSLDTDKGVGQPKIPIIPSGSYPTAGLLKQRQR